MTIASLLSRKFSHSHHGVVLDGRELEWLQLSSCGYQVQQKSVFCTNTSDFNDSLPLLFIFADIIRLIVETNPLSLRQSHYIALINYFPMYFVT
jgi:hypothetical protein